MQTWAVWTFGLLALNTALKTLALGIGDYPRSVGRGVEAFDALITAAWLLWGACAIW